MIRSMVAKVKYLTVWITLISLSLFGNSVGQQLPGREAEPLVVSGADISIFEGVQVASIAAYRYDKNTGWHIIPSQVDEKDSILASKAYGNIDPEECVVAEWCSGLDMIKIHTYTDANTFVGPDSNPFFDKDDEVVIMLKDAGEGAEEHHFPPGTDPERYIEMRLEDPVDGNTAFIYLFLHLDTPVPALKKYVNYEFDLLSGTYKDNYRIGMGPNTENSTITTGNYQISFSDRWVQESLKILVGPMGAANLIDRHKNLFAPDNCGRHEETFSAGEGAFLANKSGPVRAIRAYMGANSGPLTRREHFYYEKKEVIQNHLHVHPIPGIMDLYDYSPEAGTLNYFNNNNPQGVTIDGKPDLVAPGRLEWEWIKGTAGSIFRYHQIHSSAPLNITSYYSDDNEPLPEQCTGDNIAYGTSGHWIDQRLFNTDPRLNNEHETLTISNNNYYHEPSVSQRYIHTLIENYQKPLQVTYFFKEQEPRFKIYPNPVSDGSVLTVQLPGPVNYPVNIRLLNVWGIMVDDKYFYEGQSLQMHLTGFSSGVYIVQVIDQLAHSFEERVLIL